MSDASLDLREQIARIDRTQADIERSREETAKFIREAHKLQMEAMKLHAEEIKLQAEALKLNRDRGLAPWLAIVGLIGGLLAIANFTIRFLH